MPYPIASSIACGHPDYVLRSDLAGPALPRRPAPGKQLRAGYGKFDRTHPESALEETVMSAHQVVIAPVLLAILWSWSRDSPSAIRAQAIGTRPRAAMPATPAA